MFGSGATIANTTLPRNTSKASKESKRIGGVKTMPSVSCFSQLLLYLGDKVLFLSFYETISFLLCFPFGTAEWKTKLILVKKQRLCFFKLAGDTKQEGAAKSGELD